MAIVTINDKHLTDIANAIRGKNNTVTGIRPADMASAIVNLPTGGGSDISALNYVEINASNKYRDYATLPDLTPYVNSIDKIVAMVWCGDKVGSVYVYFRGIKDYRIFFLRDTYDIRSSDTPVFETPTSSPYYYYSIDGDLSGLKVKYSSSTMSTAFSNGLIMLYED